MVRFRPLRATVAIAAAATVLTLTGLSAPAFASTNAPPSHTVVSVSFTAASVPAGNFGDSYASGLGGSPYEPGSDTATDQCDRSLTSAFYLLAAAHQIQPVVNAACNGATTANLYASGQYGEPPQADQLAAHRGVKEYIVIVGGNDVGFAALFQCFVVEACENTPLPARALAAAQNLGPALSEAYGALQKAAPHAHGVVVLYPPLLPRDGSSLTGCPYIDPSELTLGNQIEAALNKTIAATAKADGLTVADPSQLFAGHSLCAGHASWFYSPTQAGAGHPNLRGRGALAVAIAAQS
jgi:GDSL-like Lipase/Acylhydrolase family